MHSGIYQGWLRHRRFTPSMHSFRYRVFMMYLDLEELDAILALSPFWSSKPWRPARFQRSDFLGNAGTPLDIAVRQRIEQQTGVYHRGPIRLLANLRYFGYNLNPISNYYCFDETGKLKTIVAEVNNTPWGERHSYVLDCQSDLSSQHFTFAKRMHVSPFNPMEMSYDWRSNNPAQALSVHLASWQDGVKHLDATLALKREEISPSSLNRILWIYPFMTLKVVLAIYWQAIRLWLKKVPVHDHPGTQTHQIDQKLTPGEKVKNL